jgi:drug/metabolite transporter (DMT)-like permease
MIGFSLTILAMISIGALGILSKLAERKGCHPLHTSLALFGGATVLMALDVGFSRQVNFAPPVRIAGMGILFGTLAVSAFWVFLYGLRFGKITTSWVFFNLSAAVPVVLSIIVYKESVKFHKLFIFGLVILSIMLLWKDMERDNGGK